MVVFWSVVAVVLAALFVNAWRLDRRAARQGKVLIPVRTGLGRRTQWMAVDKSERDERLAAARLAEMDKERADRRLGPSNGGYMKAGDFVGGFLGGGLTGGRRGRRR